MVETVVLDCIMTGVIQVLCLLIHLVRITVTRKVGMYGGVVVGVDLHIRVPMDRVSTAVQQVAILDWQAVLCGAVAVGGR